MIGFLFVNNSLLLELRYRSNIVVTGCFLKLYIKNITNAK